MPGLGSESKLGIAKETTPSTPVVPSACIPFTSEGFSAPRTLLESETIGGSSMLKNTVPGDPESSGSITQEFDAESSGTLLDLWNGPNGYTDSGAQTSGHITAAPTTSAGSTGGTVPAGDWIYQVCAVWTHNYLGTKHIMPKSAAATAVTVTLGQVVTINFTDPTGLTFADHTYAGTAVYRSTVGGAASTCHFLKFVSGTGASTTDNGTNALADTTVVPVPNTTYYKHIMVGASAATGEDRIEYFTAQLSKNVGSDEQYFGNKVNDFSLEIPGRAETVKLTVNTQGDDYVTVSGEFGAAAPTPKQQILGRNAAVVIEDVKNCEIQSLTLTGTNNCTRQSTLCGNSISEGGRRVGLNLTLLFRDRDLFDVAQSGEEIEMQLYLYGEPLVASGSHLSLVQHGVEAIPFPRLAKFDIQSLVLGEFSNPVEGPDQIIASATGQAKENVTSGTDLTITLWNTIDDYT